MKKYKISSSGFQNTVTHIFSFKNQISLHVFQNADFSLDTFISTLGTIFSNIGECSFSKLWETHFRKESLWEVFLFLWEAKEAEFGSLDKFRTVLKGSICFRLDALNTLQWLEWSTSSRTGTAGA